MNARLPFEAYSASYCAALGEASESFFQFSYRAQAAAMLGRHHAATQTHPLSLPEVEREADRMVREESPEDPDAIARARDAGRDEGAQRMLANLEIRFDDTPIAQPLADWITSQREHIREGRIDDQAVDTAVVAHARGRADGLRDGASQERERILGILDAWLGDEGDQRDVRLVVAQLHAEVPQ